jgi:hypothetical protein
MKPKKFRGQTLAGTDLAFSIQCIYQEPNLPGEIVVESKEQFTGNTLSIQGVGHGPSAEKIRCMSTHR